MNLSPGDKLWEYVSNLAKDSGLVLYDLFCGSGGSIRVFLDKLHIDDFSEEPIKKRKGSAVTSEDCSSFCRRLVHGFSVDGTELGVGAEPGIEVSSPGLNRDLRLADHFNWSVGHLIKVVKVDGGMLLGKVTNFDGETLKIITEVDTKGNRNKKTKASSNAGSKENKEKRKNASPASNESEASVSSIDDIKVSEILIKISEIKRASVNY